VARDSFFENSRRITPLFGKPSWHPLKKFIGGAAAVTPRERLNSGKSPRVKPDGDDLSPSLRAHIGGIGGADATKCDRVPFYILGEKIPPFLKAL
jgi:hypothetical protein